MKSPLAGYAAPLENSREHRHEPATGWLEQRVQKRASRKHGIPSGPFDGVLAVRPHQLAQCILTRASHYSFLDPPVEFFQYRESHQPAQVVRVVDVFVKRRLTNTHPVGDSHKVDCRWPRFIDEFQRGLDDRVGGESYPRQLQLPARNRVTAAAVSSGNSACG